MLNLAESIAAYGWFHWVERPCKFAEWRLDTGQRYLVYFEVLIRLLILTTTSYLINLILYAKHGPFWKCHAYLAFTLRLPDKPPLEMYHVSQSQMAPRTNKG